MSDRRTGWTDWARIDRQTDEEIAASVASDPDAAPLLTEEWFAKAVIAPPNKKAISIRLDAHVVEFFQATGERYQTRINQLLRAYVEAHKKPT